jgi:hypothetical protein
VVQDLGENVVKKRTLTLKDMDLEPDPVWTQEGNRLIPRPFFFKWWQEYAKRKYGDDGHWLDAAFDLGYVAKYTDPANGHTYFELAGFDYDPTLARVTLGITDQEPVVLWDCRPNVEEAERSEAVLDWLFRRFE